MLESAIVIVLSILSLVIGFVYLRQMIKLPVGNKKMTDTAGVIEKEVKKYFLKLISIIGPISGLIFVALLYLFGFGEAFTFILGAALCISISYFAALSATKTNVRAAEAGRTQIEAAFDVCLKGGQFVSYLIFALGLLSVIAVYLVSSGGIPLYTFMLGSIVGAIFLRLAGGIYAKSVDIGSSIGGKIDQLLAENDPRNPAIIADCSGDNLGDIAGSASGLFAALTAALSALIVILIASSSSQSIFLPLLFIVAGFLATVITAPLVGANEKGKISLLLAVILNIALAFVLFFAVAKFEFKDYKTFYSTVSGAGFGILAAIIAWYFTSAKSRVVKAVAAKIVTGVKSEIKYATLFSTIAAILILALGSVSVYLFYHFFGLTSVPLFTLGFIAILPTVATLNFSGPVADNAAAIAKISNLPDNITKQLDALDEAGNSFASTGKTLTVILAAFAALTIGYEYLANIGLNSLDFKSIEFIAGIAIGVILIALFSLNLMKIIKRSAAKIVLEIQRQFREISGLQRGRIEPEYQNCQEISLSAALKNFYLPGIIILLVSIVVSFTLGEKWELGILVGIGAAGIICAIFSIIFGGILDSAKKIIEDDKPANDNILKTAREGDIIGDSYKDVIGPVLMIVALLISITAILALPALTIIIPLYGKLIIGGVSVIGLLAYSVFGNRN